MRSLVVDLVRFVRIRARGAGRLVEVSDDLAAGLAEGLVEVLLEVPLVADVAGDERRALVEVGAEQHRHVRRAAGLQQLARDVGHDDAVDRGRPLRGHEALLVRQAAVAVVGVAYVQQDLRGLGEHAVQRLLPRVAAELLNERGVEVDGVGPRPVRPLVERARVDHRPVEEAARVGHHEVHRDGRGASALAEQRHPRRVPAEGGDVRLDPLQPEALVLQAEVAGGLALVAGLEVLGGKEAEDLCSRICEAPKEDAKGAAALTPFL